MYNNSLENFPHNAPKCEVCAKVISYPETLQSKKLGYQVCRSFECQRIMSQKSTMTPSLFESHLRFQQKLESERREIESADKRKIEQSKEKEDRENRSVLRYVLETNSDIPEDRMDLVIIPTGLSTQVSLEKVRIENYTKHLKDVIRTTFAQTDRSILEMGQDFQAHQSLIKLEQRFLDNPSLRTRSDQLCSMCKGGCCSAGGDQAYISPLTIKHLLDVNPTLTEVEVLDSYLEKLSDKTISSACINQTTSGCALPTSLRADICNAFYCEGLKSHQQGMIENEEIKFVTIIQRGGTSFNAYRPYVNNEIVNVALIEDSRSSIEDISIEGFEREKSKDEMISEPL